MLNKIWFDITNTPQVHFLLAIRSMLSEKFTDFVFTARDFSETLKLIEKAVDNSNLHIIRATYGTNRFRKVISLFDRYSSINSLSLDYELSISCGSDSAIWHSFIHGNKSIAFGDNDTARQWTYSRFVDFAFFPDAIDADVLYRQGLRKKLYRYSGLKEDIYLSYYKPDKSFMEKIPFERYMVVRPENIHANYLNNGKVISIVPDLLSQLSAKGMNVIYLPRYQEDMAHAYNKENIFIPDDPLNGLDLCYYADAVLTGAGTFAREAACLGIPSFSFYAGRQLLAVDRKLIAEKKMYHSRDVDLLVANVLKSEKHEPDLSHSVMVREELKEKLLDTINVL